MPNAIMNANIDKRFNVWPVKYKNAPVPKDGKIFNPRRGKRNLYFDFENTDDLSNSQPPHTYLIGVWEKETRKYTAFLAKGAQDEEKIFREFLEFAMDSDENSLYHWTECEVHSLRQIAGKYPQLREKIKAAISCCVDIKAEIQKAFYLPSPSFSLKAAAPAFGFSWRQSECNAMDSMVYYWEWLESGDDELINKVLTYNEDDCIAMYHVDKAVGGTL